MDEATWLSSTHFQRLYAYVKTGQGAALTKGGRRRLRLLACACCRCLLWHLPVRDCDRQAVEAAEAFADGLTGREALKAAGRAGYDAPFLHGRAHTLTKASIAMLAAAGAKAATTAYYAAPQALAALATQDRQENKKRLCDLVRDIFGAPFRHLAPRTFPAHVVELARDCYATFPAVSNRFLILADALADIGEEEAAEHCRRAEHVKGCHTLDWILSRK